MEVRRNARRLLRLYREAGLLILSNLAIKLIFPLLFLRRPFALRHHSESAFRLSGSIFSPDVIRRIVRDCARHFVTSGYIGRVSALLGYVVTSPFPYSSPSEQDVLPPQNRSGALLP
jgi:hypothetical protein